MASIVSSRNVSAQDLQALQYTIDTWDDGTKTLRTNDQGTGGGTSGVISGAITNRSGTIAAGGTAQQAMASNTSRKYVYLLNPDTATEDLWFSFDATAAATSPSIYLHPGDAFESTTFVPTGALSVIAATTTHPYIAKEA